MDDRPLSEVERLAASATGGRNYLQWLIDAASSSLERLYAQEDFLDDQPPTALLYLLSGMRCNLAITTPACACTSRRQS